MEKIGRSTQVPADRSYIGEILGEISSDTKAESRILLSVLVHRNTSGQTKPGPGFFSLAKGLGYAWNDDDKFVEEQTRKVLSYYARNRRKA
jgi:hypothetical protein